MCTEGNLRLLVVDDTVYYQIQDKFPDYFFIKDALNYIQKERSDDTNDTQLPMHVLVSCPDHVHLLVRDSLVPYVQFNGPIPRMCVARTNEIVRLLVCSTSSTTIKCCTSLLDGHPNVFLNRYVTNVFDAARV